MMTGGSDEEGRQQVMESPVMFPRLHVTDREKGGPRAPPRNKMALYEQFSIPLPPQQSVCGGSASTGNGGGGQQSYTYRPSYNIPATSGSARQLKISSSARIGFNNAMGNSETDQASNIAPVLSLPAKTCSSQQRISQFSRTCQRKRGGRAVITFPRHRNQNISSHKAHQNEPLFELRRLGLIDLETGQLRGVPLPQYPAFRKSPPVTLRPLIKNVENPQVLKRPHVSLSQLQKESSVLQDFIPGGDCELSTVPQKEGINGTPSELEREGVSASSRLSPDDVEKVIGQKIFWKVRQAIIDQQRVFTVQLFELHRLLKVQNLISRSPHIRFEENLGFKNSPGEVSPSEFVPTMRLNSKTDQRNAIGKPAFNAGNIEMPRVPAALQPNQRPCMEKVPEPANTDRSDMSCCPPIGNQWLVPIVSPSEGLVYKPYTGPGPPGTGILAPVSDPIKLGVGCGKELRNTALHNLPSIGPSYFPPYGMLVMNCSKPNHTPEQETSFGWRNPKEPLEQVSQVESLSLGKNRGREVEGSTASSPSGKLTGELALPLFPTTPVTGKGDSYDIGKQQTKAIKVIPYNSKRASESAARILQLIKEERRRLTND